MKSHTTTCLLLVSNIFKIWPHCKSTIKMFCLQVSSGKRKKKALRFLGNKSEGFRDWTAVPALCAQVRGSEDAVQGNKSFLISLMWVSLKIRNSRLASAQKMSGGSSVHLAEQQGLDPNLPAWSVSVHFAELGRSSYAICICLLSHSLDWKRKNYTAEWK